MITPFDENLDIDLPALKKLISWYIEYGKVGGLFAVCQSSEMFYLSLEERIKLASLSVQFAEGRVPVIASGHTSIEMNKQITEISALADTGVDAIVLLTNKFAESYEDDTVWKKNLLKFLKKIPSSLRLGLYECPYPYKRLLKPETVAWCASLGRFDFYKDTSCELESISKKIRAVLGTSLKIFNANSATLLDSLKAGCSGYSGVMANFHPLLYGWLTANYANTPDLAEYLQSYLGVSSLVERQLYPMNAKYVLSRYGLPVGWNCRKNNTKDLTEGIKKELDQFIAFDAKFTKDFFKPSRIGPITQLTGGKLDR